MRTIAKTAAITVLLLQAAGASQAALNFYITIKASKQGEIKGEVTQKGREGTIMGIAYSHEIVSPRDVASGLATGKRQHKPVVVTIESGQSTPQLMIALATNENLPSVELKFWRPSILGTGGTGVEQQYMTVTLHNARIAGISTRMLNNKDPQLTRYAMYHEVSFTYQRIEVSYMNGQKTFQDDWLAVADGGKSRPTATRLPARRLAAAKR